MVAKLSEPKIIVDADINPRHDWSRAIYAPGVMNVDFEERVDFRRLHRYRLARTRQALARSDLGTDYGVPTAGREGAGAEALELALPAPGGADPHERARASNPQRCGDPRRDPERRAQPLPAAPAKRRRRRASARFRRG